MVLTTSSVSEMPDTKTLSLIDKKLTLYKLPCAGGKGGYKFDAGCNPYGVARVHIECSPFNLTHKSTIARIFMDFRQPTTSHADKNQFYWGCDVVASKHKKTFNFELTPGDSICKAIVWSDGFAANAVQFHTRLGIISPMYGIAPDNSKPTEFQAPEGTDCHLVGFHGRFGRFIVSLGFTFASLEHEDIPDSISEL